MLPTQHTEPNRATNENWELDGIYLCHSHSAIRLLQFNTKNFNNIQSWHRNWCLKITWLPAVSDSCKVCVRAVRAARERLKTNRKPRKLFLILCVCAMEKLICVVVRSTMKNKHTSERASKRDRMVKNKSHIKWPHHCYCYSTYIHNAHTMQLVFFRQRKCAKWEYSFENNNSAKSLHCEKKCKFHWTSKLSSWK